MSKKNRLPPVDIKIQWTEDETNLGGKEPSQKLVSELTQVLARIVARRDMAMGVKERDAASLQQSMSDVFRELVASARVQPAKAPKPDKK